MTHVLGLDFESTGLDTYTANIIEVGAVIWSVEDKIPLDFVSKFVCPPVLPIPEEITKLTGIKSDWVEQYGTTLGAVLCHIDDLVKKYGVQYVVAHNGENYDKPLLMSECKRIGQTPLFADLHWLDTRSDLPFEVEPTSRRLSHLALDCGFMSPFSHRALFDVMTMLRVLSTFDFEKVVENSRIPWVIARALVDYDNRQLAKDARFSWEKIGEESFPKMWVKKIKENQLELEQKNAEAKNFKIIRIK